MKAFTALCFLVALVHVQTSDMDKIACKEKLHLTTRDIEMLEEEGNWEVLNRLKACVWQRKGIIKNGVLNKQNLTNYYEDMFKRELEIVSLCHEKVDKKGPTEDWIVVGEFEECYWFTLLDDMNEQYV